MADAYHHSVSTAKKFGGDPHDYIHVHYWFDETKAHFPDPRHRALRHHAEGIAWAIKALGFTVHNSASKEIPIRLIAEQHIVEDCGWIPTIKDWLIHMNFEAWMDKPMKNLDTTTDKGA